VAPLGAGGFHLDPDRLTRFQREAEMVASLSHPYIDADGQFQVIQPGMSN